MPERPGSDGEVAAAPRVPAYSQVQFEPEDGTADTTAASSPAAVDEDARAGASPSSTSPSRGASGRRPGAAVAPTPATDRPTAAPPPAQPRPATSAAGAPAAAPATAEPSRALTPPVAPPASRPAGRPAPEVARPTPAAATPPPATAPAAGPAARPVLVRSGRDRPSGTRGATTAGGTSTAAAGSAHVPLRVPREAGAPVRVAPVRALAGAGLAVAAVVLGIGALLLVTDDPEGPATVASPAAVGGPAPVAPPPAEAPSVAPPPAEPPSVEPPSVEPPTAEPPTAAPPTGAPATGRPEPAPTRTAPAAPARPALTVLNNSRLTGLAAREAQALRQAGWPVAVVGNLRGRTRTSTVYYEAGQRAVAERLARAHGIPRVLPRREGLPGRGLTVVVTRDRA